MPVVTPRVTFAHESEAALARLFDFYGIEWLYEPRTFPIVWNARGEAVQFFTPDFYLPEYDLFLELTTAKPYLKTRKNRKMRLLRDHHPHVNVKLFTRRDIERIFSRMAAAA
jgi:hypothetical protein